MPYRKQPIGDWKGWDNSSPAIMLEPNSFKQIINWLINKGRLYPFPKLGDFPSLPGNNKTVLGMRTFQDALGNYHTLFLNSDQPFYLNADGTYNPLFDSNGNMFSPTNNAFFSIEVYLNQPFFANGGAPLSYVQGDQGFYTAGNVPGSCYFLGKLASHLMMVNTIEPVAGTLGSMNFPARVRWSASGDPTQWDLSVDLTAGAEDISDVEDQLTGWSTIGSNGYAFRNNGITVFSPTGIGTAPFYVENFSIGPQGVGCSIPYTLATYGPFCTFVALDDIYIFDGGAPNRIGGKAKKSIFRDIDTSVAPVSAFMMGTLLGGTDFLSYWLSCPQVGDVTSMWIYHFDSQSWVNIQLPFGALSYLQNVAGVAGLDTFGWGLNWGTLWGEGS
jgi:hypothetical protein